MIEHKPNQFVIVGVTEAGQKFRPSDWAERIAGNLSSFKKQRIHYSPLLYPSCVERKNCLFVDKSLIESNPPLFTHIVDFARKNHLETVGEIPKPE